MDSHRCLQRNRHHVRAGEAQHVLQMVPCHAADRTTNDVAEHNYPHSFADAKGPRHSLAQPLLPKRTPNTQ